jgi:LPXTG-motif cell wall-anchored protein
MIARSFRYYVEGILAVFYGRRVLLFMKDNGLVILSIVGALVLLGVIIYLLRRRKSVSEIIDEETPAVERTTD